MFQKSIVFVFALVFLAACVEKSVEVTGPPEPANPPVVVEDIEVPQQTNVVTPEFWEAFDTDIQAVYFYSKIDSLQIHLPLEKELAKSFCEENGISYHEYYTNDNMGLVQLDDTLFFDLTDHLISNEEGFLFLKHGKMQDVADKSVNESFMDSSLTAFFKN